VIRAEAGGWAASAPHGLCIMSLQIEKNRGLVKPLDSWSSLMTAGNLERLWMRASSRGDGRQRALIDTCEEVASVENQAWMAHWSKTPTT
jgi:hypothetical protein